MCVAVIAKGMSDRYPLIVVSNRDEFRGRAASRAHFWTDDSNVLAGRDLEKGGTWLGVTRTGRVALVTNYREPNPFVGPKSRGDLVSDFLRGTDPAADYLDMIEPDGDAYSGYNLIVFDGTDIGYASNRGGSNQILGDGSFGLSNHLLDTPWPKVSRSKKGVVDQINESDLPLESLIGTMRDPSRAEDADLPSTGVPLDLERRLSSIFIEGGEYGTRCTSIVAIRDDGKLLFAEQAYDNRDQVVGRNTFVV